MLAYSNIALYEATHGVLMLMYESCKKYVNGTVGNVWKFRGNCAARFIPGPRSNGISDITRLTNVESA